MANPAIVLDELHDPYETALLRALADLDSISTRLESARTNVIALEAELASRRRLVDSLIDALSPVQRAQYLQRISALKASARSGPVNPIHRKVISLFGELKRRDLAATDIYDALNKSGDHVDKKGVYNLLGYLEREGQLVRVSRGMYRIQPIGAGVAGLDFEED